MACKVCDHTMHKIAQTPAVWWCPRCGTLKSQARYLIESEQLTDVWDEPKLVDRATKLVQAVGETDREDVLEPLMKAVDESVGLLR